MFTVNNKDTRTTPRHWRRSSVFIANFEYISYLVLVFLLLALNIQLLVGKLLVVTISSLIACSFNLT